MADDRIPSPPPARPDADQDTGTTSRSRRPVYEPTLLPERRHRRVSPWLVIPLLLLGLGGLLYFLLIAPRHARFVPTVGEIVYASDQGSPGIPHLWVAQKDGTGAHALTSGPAADTAPAFSPSGSQIAFLSDRDSKQTQVFVMDADGRNMVQITRNTGAKTAPAWSSGDPEALGYTAGGALSVISFVRGEAGDADRLLPPPPAAPHTQTPEGQLTDDATITVPSYVWSPAKTGGLAAVEDTGSFQALAVVPSLTDTPKDTQQTPQGNNVPLAAADTLSLGWSPDGGLLAAAMLGIKGLPGGIPSSGIVLFDRDGSSSGGRPPLLIQGATTGPQNPVFSPDGTQILFELWRQPDLASRRRLGLFLVPTDGSRPPQIVYRGDASQAQFAPDGSTIFFLVARPGGGHDLCRIAPDGTGFQRLSDGQADISGLSASPQAAAS